MGGALDTAPVLREFLNIVLRQYLIDAIAAEKSIEQYLRTIFNEADDTDVQLAFAQLIEETRSQRGRLENRLAALAGSESEAKNPFPSLLDIAPQIGQAGHCPEERLVSNLITAFSLQTGECAMYEALAQIARASGDKVTEQLAREIEAEEQRAAEKLFHFIPTRSKIAFNVLTAHEVDPAIETKVGLS